MMVDFTADWCPNCKTNLKFVIETEEVLQLIKKNNVVPMLADWTDASPEISDALRSLGSRAIPVLAIYPPGEGQSPIVLRDLLRKQEVLDALSQAGPSRHGGRYQAAGNNALGRALEFCAAIANSARMRSKTSVQLPAPDSETGALWDTTDCRRDRSSSANRPPPATPPTRAVPTRPPGAERVVTRDHQVEIAHDGRRVVKISQSVAEIEDL